ncbi:MAG: DNA-binding protein [Mycoplasmataceae bacterium]|nr:DNA-binding protein [Mycoplasmataceae bacterium]
MTKINDIKKYSSLYDLYNELLTEIQRRDFELYLFSDLSLSEIATERNTSRAAIYDNVKKVQNHLEQFESKLHWTKKYKKIDGLLEKIKNEKNVSKRTELIKEIRMEL